MRGRSVARSLLMPWHDIELASALVTPALQTPLPPAQRPNAGSPARPDQSRAPGRTGEPFTLPEPPSRPVAAERPAHGRPEHPGRGRALGHERREPPEGADRARIIRQDDIPQDPERTGEVAGKPAATDRISGDASPDDLAKALEDVTIGLAATDCSACAPETASASDAGSGAQPVDADGNPEAQSAPDGDAPIVDVSVTAPVAPAPVSLAQPTFPTTETRADSDVLAEAGNPASAAAPAKPEAAVGAPTAEAGTETPQMPPGLEAAAGEATPPGALISAAAKAFMGKPEEAGSGSGRAGELKAVIEAARQGEPAPRETGQRETAKAGVDQATVAPPEAEGQRPADKAGQPQADITQAAQASQALAAKEGLGAEPSARLDGLPAQAPRAEAAPPAPELPLPPNARPLAPSAVPVEIGLRALQGLKEFQIRLDPAELGRVDVRLEIGDDKSVTARVVVDRVETLHLLQREARTLERAFEQAGLKSSDAGIDISLRDPGQQGRDSRRDDGENERGTNGRNASALPRPPEAPMISVRRLLHAGALDLSI